MYKTKTPDNIDSKSLSDIAAIATNTPGIPSAASRLRVLSMLMDVLGLDTANDNMLMLASEPIAKLCVATAGAGKTTSANVQIIEEKIIRKSRVDPSHNLHGDKVLCLLYNKHNVADFKKRHQEMVGRLRAANIGGLHIDDDLQVSTMHAFCDQWRREYAVECDLVNFRLAQEDHALSLMKTAVTAACQKYKIEKVADINVQDVYTLYTYAKESMLDSADLSQNDKFIDLGLELEVVTTIFDIYERMKKLKRYYDFSDMLTAVYRLLSTRPDILKNIQRFYEYVVVDEFQDFTPLMMELLKLFVNNGTPLLCIGDDDQSIYGFRGADIYNTLDFSEKFPGGEIYVLATNRRCREKILQHAKVIIEKNDMRYKKSIKGIKSGGDVQYIAYTSVEGQLLNVLQKVKTLNMPELQKTVICYRNQECSMVLSQILAENHIQHYVISGYHAYSHELYRHIIDILFILSRPRDTYAQLNLYKILPIKREAVQQILKYDPSQNRFSDDVEKKDFTQIDYGQYLTFRNFKECLSVLKKISSIINTAPLRVYFNTIWEYFKMYFWNLKKNFNKNEEIDTIFENKVYNTFNCDLTFQELYNKLSTQKNICKRNQEMRNGLALSTFHSLKGLEYNNVFMIYLDNEITPSYARIDDRPYSPELKKSLKEAEVRLFYVAMTRARDNLYMYYNETNPSIFMKYLWECDKAAPTKAEEQAEDDDFLSDADMFSDDFLFDEGEAVEDALSDENKELFSEIDKSVDHVDSVMHSADLKLMNQSSESSSSLASFLNKNVMDTLLSRIG